jgi:Uma2 family endonuclease
MLISAKYRPYYTYEDYCQWEGRWELIEGMPYAMNPLPGPVHQRVCILLGVQFLEALEKCKNSKVYPAIDWKITEDTVVQPDLIISANIAIEKEFLDFTPELIVEILSDATVSKDRGEKMELYQSQKVKYYVIVDPQFKKVEIYEYLNTQYGLVSVNPKTYVFKLHDNCTVKVKLLDIWD